MKKTFKKVCRACGKEYVTERKDQVYCSLKCSNGVGKHQKVESHDASLEWVRSQTGQNRWLCPYQECVSCRTRNCEKCGWCPTVATARLKAVYEKGK